MAIGKKIVSINIEKLSIKLGDSYFSNGKINLIIMKVKQLII